MLFYAVFKSQFLEGMKSDGIVGLSPKNDFIQTLYDEKKIE
jgi:hypothetical protein